MKEPIMNLIDTEFETIIEEVVNDRFEKSITGNRK